MNIENHFNKYAKYKQKHAPFQKDHKLHVLDKKRPEKLKDLKKLEASKSD